MPQISNSQDVYRQLVEDSDEDWLYGLEHHAFNRTHIRLP